MTNCKNEFLEETRGKEVLCAQIIKGPDYAEERKFHSLQVGYSPQEFDAFCESLNFEYHSGFGGQEVFGTIWYKDGTWSERVEYDGSECWEYKFVPEIPQELKITRS